MSEAWSRLKNDLVPSPLHPDGSNNMRWVLFLLYFPLRTNFRQIIGKSHSKMYVWWFVGFVFLLPPITLMGEQKISKVCHETVHASNDLELLKFKKKSDKFVFRPYFGSTETEVTVQQGEEAFFNCKVFNVAIWQTVSCHCHHQCHHHHPQCHHCHDQTKL